MAFDLPPVWFSKISQYRGLRPTPRYKVPPMPFSLSSAQATDLARTVPGIRRVQNMPMPSGRGLALNVAVSIVYRAPFFDALRPSMTLLEFG